MADKGKEHVFDSAFALNQVSNDTELMAELWEIFREQAEEIMVGMRHALSGADASMLRENAHTLKGAVSNFGAETTVSLAKRLEKMGRESDLRGAESTLTELQTELTRLSNEINAFLSEAGLEGYTIS